jgi:lycopene beta-cyclase
VEKTRIEFQAPTHYDLILLGGGLANGLVALFLKRFRPEVSFLMIEQESRLGGNHTWSFHHSDLEALGEEVFRLISPLIECSWDSYTVFFPKYSRVLKGGYHSISSDKFHEYLSQELKGSLLLDSQVIRVSTNQVVLEGGAVFTSAAVLDGRGFKKDSSSSKMNTGFQKFVGLDVTLEEPHGLKAPILMDVFLPQSTDGYRFFYSLPWSDTRVLIEDTYYSNSPNLDVPEITKGISAYALSRGWKVKSIDRTESGVLPIPLNGDWKDLSEGPSGEKSNLPCSGVRAGLFQAVTGYSLPYAAGFAQNLCKLPKFDHLSLLAFTQGYSESSWKKGWYFRLLNRMMFLAALPAERYKIFEGFYRHSESLIERFYSGNLSRVDYALIFMMRPPVKIYSALKAMKEYN